MKFDLSYPVNPPFINQKFGINGEYYRRNGINIDGHNGLDFFAYHGQPVYAAHDGEAFYQSDANEGHGVVIVSDVVYTYKDTTACFKTIYWHFCDPKKEPKYASPVYLALGKKVNTSKSVKVKRGDLIGFADSTGLSTGDHLHFGLKPIMTGKPLKAGDRPDVGIGNWKNIEQENGYLGSIDPMPYFNGTFVETKETAPEPKKSYLFTRDLTIGSTGEDVRELQKYLNAKGFSVAKSGAGSKENETTYFGTLTRAALARFQKQNGIYPSAGYFGPITRGYLADNQ